MSFGRNSGSRFTPPVWTERVLIVLLYLCALGLGYATGVLISCVAHSWCPP